jgi:DNA-directed RNA polymerase specialized sigma subunit
MSDIVVDLKKRNWSDEKIARELGMDADEVLRLCQISGLAEMFSDQEFSQAWEINSVNDLDNLEDEELSTGAEEVKTTLELANQVRLLMYVAVFVAILIAVLLGTVVGRSIIDR